MIARLSSLSLPLSRFSLDTHSRPHLLLPSRLVEQLGQFYAYWYVNTDQAVEALRP